MRSRHVVMRSSSETRTFVNPAKVAPVRIYLNDMPSEPVVVRVKQRRCSTLIYSFHLTYVHSLLRFN